MHRSIHARRLAREALERASRSRADGAGCSGRGLDRLAEHHLARREVVAIDASYGDPAALLAGLEGDVPTLAVAPDGLAGLADALETRCVDALHLFCAGDDRRLRIGGETFDPTAPDPMQRAACQRLARALAAGGEPVLHLYGSDFGRDAGPAAQALARLLGAGVAATLDRGEGGEPAPEWHAVVARPHSEGAVEPLSDEPLARIAVGLDPLAALALGEASGVAAAPVRPSLLPHDATSSADATRVHPERPNAGRDVTRTRFDPISSGASGKSGEASRGPKHSSERLPTRTGSALSVRALTLEILFRPDDPTTRGPILALPAGPAFQLDGPRASFVVPTPEGERTATADLSRLGIEDASRRLVHLVGTVRDDWACLYVEGALAGTARLSGADREWSVPLRPPAHGSFGGEMPLRRLYARALTGREVLENHGATRPKGGTPTKGAMWSSRDGRRGVALGVASPAGERDAPEPRVDDEALDGAMAITGKHDTAAGTAAMSAAEPGQATVIDDPWRVAAPVITTLVTVGPLPVEVDDPRPATRPVPDEPTRPMPEADRSSGADAVRNESPGAARGRANEALRLLRERGQLPVDPLPTSSPAGREGVASRDRAHADTTGDALTHARTAAPAQRSRVPARTASERAPTERSATPAETHGPIAPPERLARDAACSVSVRAGEAVRIDLPDVAGCTLRGSVSFWPSALPDWLSLDETSGTVAGTAPDASEPIVPIAVVASNGRGATATLSLTLAIEAAEADADRREAAEAWEAVERAMRSTLDAIPALRERIEAGSRSGRIRLRSAS